MSFVRLQGRFRPKTVSLEGAAGAPIEAADEGLIG